AFNHVGQNSMKITASGGSVLRGHQQSSRFPVQNLPEKVHEALSALEARFKTGQDVNPYLSKTTINNDVSAPKSQRRTDGLWADWGIHHLHLTTEPLAANTRFSERSDWLLFVKVYEDVVAFIDVRSHDEKDLWTQEELLTTFIDSWPEQAEPYRISGMQVTSRPMAAGDLKKLRNAGITSPVEHNGEHYFGLGGGVTSAVTSTAASLACIQVRRNAQQLARWLDLPNNPIRLEFVRLGVPQPQFILGVGDDGLVIAERSRLDIGGCILPECDEQGNRTTFAMVQDRLLPKWAISTLMAHVRSKA
ncbi:hypothetical protein, partial [Burkholderia stagnalis]